MKNRSTFRYTSRHQLVRRIRREHEAARLSASANDAARRADRRRGFSVLGVLIQAGLDELAWRYGLAVAIAYVFFLMLLWLWLRTGPGNYDGLGDVMVEVVDAIPERAAKIANQHAGQGGGEFGGGGASSNWTNETTSEPLVELQTSPICRMSRARQTPPTNSRFHWPSCCSSSLSCSPCGVLLGDLHAHAFFRSARRRRARRDALSPPAPTRLTPLAAVRFIGRIVPFAVTALLLMIAGWVLSLYAPEARTIGEVFAAA